MKNITNFHVSPVRLVNDTAWDRGVYIQVTENGVCEMSWSELCMLHLLCSPLIIFIMVDISQFNHFRLPETVCIFTYLWLCVFIYPLFPHYLSFHVLWLWCSLRKVYVADLRMPSLKWSNLKQTANLHVLGNVEKYCIHLFSLL